MPVLPVQNPGSIRIKLDLGLVDGKAKTKSKTYSNVKVAATDQDIFDVANAIMELQKYPVLDVVKQEYTSLNA